MCPLTLIETLRMEGGRILRLPYHEARRAAAIRHFWPAARPLSLAETLRRHGLMETNSPERYPGVWKVRVAYNAESARVEAEPYSPKHIARLRLVADDTIDYSFKYSDRSALTRCRNRRGDADEVIIAKNGLLTDTSYSNIALFNGSEWLTPHTPLLAGTMRASLIDNHLLRPADIRPAELLSTYSRLCLINAMLPLGELSIDITPDTIAF